VVLHRLHQHLSLLLPAGHHHAPRSTNAGVRLVRVACTQRSRCRSRQATADTSYSRHKLQQIRCCDELGSTYRSTVQLAAVTSRDRESAAQRTLTYNRRLLTAPESTSRRCHCYASRATMQQLTR
jgi:hypothetical protein